MNILSSPIAVVGVFLCLALSACGDKEPAQRKEFMEFLQTRILDKQGARVPRLSDNQKEAFGPYTKDYAIITDFAADRSLEQRFSAIMTKVSIRSSSDLVARREDLISGQKLIAELDSAIDQSLATAEVAKAQLKQPDDLRTIFDKVYERDVTTVAKSIKQMFPPIQDMIVAALRVSDFIAQHKDRIEITGTMVTAKDQETLSALQPLLKDFNTRGQAVLALQRTVRATLGVRN